MSARAWGIKDQRHDPPVIVSELGMRLRQERNRRHVKDADIAGRLGVSATTYHRWESGMAVPDFRHYSVVADFLGETTEEVWRLVAGEPPTSNGRLKAEVSALTQLLGDQAQTIRDLRAELAQTRSRKS